MPYDCVPVSRATACRHYSLQVTLSLICVITVLITPNSRAKRLMVPRGPGSWARIALAFSCVSFALA